MILYRGPSHLNGDPILAILTGLGRVSKNRKTGPMAQLWILPEVDPLVAIKSGADAAVCGTCPLRGIAGLNRACYVTLKQAPLAVWRKFVRGGYDMVAPEAVNALLKTRKQAIRLGAYGDPLALPLSLLDTLTAGVRHTGYTHSWHLPQAKPYQTLVMASVETAKGAALAHAHGWRTFRIGHTPLQGEIVCPASPEGGGRTNCATCGLCNGAAPAHSPISILIHAHGSGQKHLST